MNASHLTTSGLKTSAPAPAPAIAVDKLQATLSQVITTMLGIGLDESNLFPPDQHLSPPVYDSRILASSVRFSGGWRGLCVVSCEAEVAKELTYRFLGLLADSPDEILSEIRDCMGEVANIVGGNVKSLLPRGVDHSIPCFEAPESGWGEVILSTAFNCSAGPLWVSLIREVQPLA